RPGHGAAVDPGRLGDVEPRRPGAPRDLGRRVRVGPTPRTPRPAEDLGDQGSAGGIIQAQGPSGALDLQRPGSFRAGPPYRSLGRHYGWHIEEMFSKVKGAMRSAAGRTK